MINFYDFISNSNLFKKFEVNELLFCEYKCIITEPVMPLWSHLNIFTYVLGGKKKWKTQQNEYMLKRGDSVFVKKGANIVEQFFDEDYCVLTIFVPDDFIKNVIKKYEIKMPGNNLKNISDKIIRLKLDEVLETYFHSVLSYFPKPDPPPKNLLKMKFEELLVDILSSNNNPDLTFYFRDLCNYNKISIREVMEDNFNYNLQLEEYSKLCGRSLSSFKRDFDEIYGISPGRWLTNKRLNFSKYLLETTDKSIDEIIFESGFKNESHFIRIFKEKFGTTPLKFRTTLQNSF